MKVYVYIGPRELFLDDPNEFIHPANELKPKGPLNQNYFQPTGGQQRMGLQFGDALFIIGGRSSITKALKLYPGHYLIQPGPNVGVKDQLVVYRREVQFNRKTMQVLMVTPTHMTSTILRSNVPVDPNGIEEYLITRNNVSFALSLSLEDISKIVSYL